MVRPLPARDPPELRSADRVARRRQAGAARDEIDIRGADDGDSWRHLVARRAVGGRNRNDLARGAEHGGVDELATGQRGGAECGL